MKDFYKLGGSPIAYIGGKHYIRKWVISHFDYSKRCYVELFGGSGEIILSKPPHKIEIFNDNNSLLINFFKVLLKDERRLAEELEKLPYARKLFEEFKKSDWESLDDFDKAVRWFYVARSSFSGLWGQGWTCGFKRNSAKAYNASILSFRRVRYRMRNVQIECRDYRKIIESIRETKEEKDIMLYVDPPYIDVNYYQTIWSLDDHKEFAELMNSLKCSVAISYYKTKEIPKWYPKNKWNYYYRETIKHSKGITKNSKNKDSKPKAVELLLTNYPLKRYDIPSERMYQIRQASIT